MIYVGAVLLAVLSLFLLTVLRGAPYVPSLGKDMEDSFGELYELSEADTLVDIGSGDGIVLRYASRQGARAVGYEINPVLILISRWLARHDNKVTTLWRDFWLTTLPADTTIIYLFAESRDIKKMTSYIIREVDRIGRRISVVSHGFELTGLKPIKSKNAYFLYEIYPLQTNKP